MEHANSLGFWRTYVFSVDHKMIGKQYMLTGLVMAVLGGLLALVMRSQLAWPGDPIPVIGVLSPASYNAVVTLHGTIMVFWVAMPVLVAGFGNYLIPLMVGADDMAFPRLNMLSYWIFLLSTVVLVASFFVPGGPASGGWTSYPPLAATPDYSGVDLGVNLWILAVALEFVAFLIGGVNFVTTSLNMRAPGMGMWDLPFFVWQQVLATLVFTLSVGPLIAGAVMLLADRTIGTGFYDPASGGDPLLFQHLFWFFGHPEVYVLLLPAVGIVGEVFCAFARKALFGYKMMVYSTITAGILSFVVWAHHQFISGMDPRLATPFSLTTILISVPFAVSMFGFIATLVGGSIRFRPPMLFAVSMIAMFLVGGVTGILNGSAATDIYIHDTYFVVAHFHYTLFPIVFLGAFTGIYHWYPKMFGRMMNEPLGWLHCIGTIVCLNLTFIPQFRLGMMGHHRRIANPNVFEFLQAGEPLQILSTIGTTGLLLSQIPFVFNFFHSMFRGAPAERNPWEATTLEWNTPSPPGHGNFESPPRVYRGPYVYSPPGDGPDYIPQHSKPVDACDPLTSNTAS